MSRARIFVSYLQTLWQRRFASRQSLEAWQEQRMQKFLAGILPLSPYYRDRIDPRRWREAPLTNKALMMRHFDRLNTVGLKHSNAMATALRAERQRDWSPQLGAYTVGLSSGTSGHRGLFLASAAEREEWAGRMLAKALPGPLWQGQRIALFLRSNSRLYQGLGSSHLRFEYFDTQEDLATQLPRLRAFDPSVLCAPPSLLRQLAATDIGLNLRRLFAVAEPLESMDRLILEERFGLSLHQIYQATEGFIAISCRQGTLHLNEDVMVVQKDWLDQASGRFSPVISDFRRRSQPILRYRLDDILTLRQAPCPCGSVFTAIDTVEGRHDDLCYFTRSDRSGLRPVYADFLRQALLLVRGVQDYRLDLLSPKKLSIALKCPSSAGSKVRAAVSREFKALARRQSFILPQLSFHTRFEAPGTHKLRRIRRHFEVAQP